jgi:hypothetical protein
MEVARYQDCLDGARVTLSKCLNVSPDEKILIVKSPFDISITDVMTASSILWWCRPLHSLNIDCQAPLRKLMIDRVDIENALKVAAEEMGCTVFFRTINTSTMLDANFNWKSIKLAKKLLKTMTEADVIIDLTLFGLDQLPPTKKSREPRFSFRDEIRKASDCRGADMHLVSRSSFVKGGAMCFDHSQILNELKLFKEKIRTSPFLTLKGRGTNLKLYIHNNKVDYGSGLIHKPKEWHFLPSGVVFVPVKISGTFGTLTLDGPMYGMGSLKKYPLRLRVDPMSHKIENFKIADNAPPHVKTLLHEMFNIDEFRHIGEVVIGFNPLGSKDSVEPMEFYVARGSVTIALGRNDHIGGEIYPADPSRPSIHVHATISNPTLTLSDGEKLVCEGKIVSGTGD